MDFDHPEAWHDKLGDYRATNVPANLSWSERSPGILAALRRRKKRRWLVIWSSAGAAFLVGGIILYFYAFSFRPLGAFPIPLMGTLETAGSEQSAFTTVTDQLRPPFRSAQHQKPPDAEPQLEAASRTPSKATGTALASINIHSLASAEDTAASVPLMDSTLSTLPPKLSPVVPIPTVPIALLSWPTPVPALSPSLPEPPKIQWSIKYWAGSGTYLPNFGGVQPLVREKALWGWQGGVVLSRPIHRNWQLLGGIQLVNQRQKVNYAATTRVMLYRPNSIDSILVNTWNGQETLIYRDSVPGRRIRQFQNYNQQARVQLPLAIGWSRQRGHWQMQVYAGGALNVLLKAKGRTLDQSGAVVELTSDTWYSYQPIPSWQIGWNGQWRMSSNWHLGALLVMDQSLKNQLAMPSGLKQKNTSIFSGISFQWGLQ
jgi:hypothetical protein